MAADCKRWVLFFSHFPSVIMPVRLLHVTLESVLPAAWCSDLLLLLRPGLTTRDCNRHPLLGRKYLA